MNRTNRRAFLADVGRAMLLAGVGSQVAGDLGLARVCADEGAAPLTFGALEPLVRAMQDTPLDSLLPLLVEKIKSGTSLNDLLAAGALANARTFGGEDYIGFHTFMALVPAGNMARELPAELAPLPVLKVLYRNTSRIQAFGGRGAEVLHPVADVPAGVPSADALHEATRRADFDTAERVFAGMMHGSLKDAYNNLQPSVQDEENVHRVVLAWRAWSTLDLTGAEHAHTLLRQTIRFCCNSEKDSQGRSRQPSAIRELLPRLLDQNGLLAKPLGERRADDEWIAKFSKTVFSSTREQAAEAAAMALAEGIAPESIGEAISLAATELLLHDPGRPERYASARFGRRQRLARHCRREQSPQHRREPHRRGVSHGRPEPIRRRRTISTRSQRGRARKPRTGGDPARGGNRHHGQRPVARGRDRARLR
jgi:hypothetical protein